MLESSHPRIKVCGITSVEAALWCAKLRIQAIGCVFHPKSPRHLADAEARKICGAVNGRLETVGVFVNEPVEIIRQKVEACGITMVQLHGNESPELVDQLREQGIPVIKTLFMDREPGLSRATSYHVNAFLVECGKGPLPGGNAQSWDWRRVREFGVANALILAGGLNPENIAGAILDSLPDAVDVSSGVESSPGKKDFQKIEKFVQAIRGMAQPGERVGSSREIFPPCRGK